MAYSYTTGFLKNFGNGMEDIGNRYMTKDYLINTYPSLVPPNTLPGVFTAGSNAYGQLGTNNITSYSSPVQIGGLTNWRTLSLGDNHLIAVKTDGTLWVVGSNLNGQLGSGNTTSYSSPVQVGALTTWRQCAAGTQYAAGVTTANTLWTWGLNSSGQLGAGTLTNRSSPVQVGALTNWKQVSAGPTHLMATKTDGTLWGTGNNSVGQTNPSISSAIVAIMSSPVQIGSLTNWGTFNSYMAMSTASSVIVKTDGTLWTWGANTSGQLGSGTATSRSSPVQVGTYAGWTYVGLGTSHAIGGQSAGTNTLWAWGLNSSGQLGTGNTTSYSSPVQVGALTNWSTSGSDNISAGSAHTHALYTSSPWRTLWAWGLNSSGQLGTGNTTSYSSPVQVGSLTNWFVVYCGY